MRADWVLIEAQFDDRYSGTSLIATVHPASGPLIELHFPVLAGGVVHQLIQLPVDINQIVWRHHDGTVVPEKKLVCHCVKWFERIWHMSYRILRTWLQLSDEGRAASGLTFFKTITDLSNSYRVATELCFPLPYEDWVKSFDTVNTAEFFLIESHIATWAVGPRFHVLVYADDVDVSGVNKTLASLKSQLYRFFDCTVVGSGPTTSVGVRFVDLVDVIPWIESFNADLTGTSAWVLRLRAGDVLPVHALYWLACAVADHPDSAIVYTDDDALNPSGRRCAPRFKPTWSLAHLRATNYFGNSVAVSGEMLALVGGLDEVACRHGLFEKILQIIDLKEENVIHLPAVLLHKGSDDCPDAAAWEMHAVQRHLVRRGIAATVSPTLPGCRRIRYQLPSSLPLVSIIIPTRDGLEILRRCVDSVLTKTTYARFEILVVDNQSRDPATLAYLREIEEHPAVRVLPFDRPFNFSAINNFAAGEAWGELLCLLNNDTEVITPDWLDEMVGHLMQDQVGVVGAKLFYPDGRVQHAGDTVGPGGTANHLHNRIARDDPGYCNRAAVAQDLSAVTAACLLTRRSLYFELGGLDARWLRVAYNDVDYCLRVRAAGWRVVWTPHSELYHHESVSRGKNDNWRKSLRSDFEAAVMRQRWRHIIRNDPFYNPNLNYRYPDFTPSRTPRCKKPWQ